MPTINLGSYPCFNNIRPETIRRIQARFNALYLPGMDIKAAIVQAVSGHLEELEQERRVMVADINRQLKEKYPALLAAWKVKRRRPRIRLFAGRGRRELKRISQGE